MAADLASGPDPSPTPRKRRYTVSEKKLASNRRNASNATGPRTPEGKERSARNAIRHGILASPAVNRVIDGENACARFEAILEGLILYYQPCGLPELCLVRAMAEAMWRHDAVARYEKAAAYYAWRDRAHHPATPGSFKKSQVVPDAELDVPTIPNFYNCNLAIRYFAMTDNAYYRAERSLERLKKSRGASLAEGADLPIPPMPPPERQVPVSETMARAQAISRAVENTGKRGRFQEAFEQSLAKGGIFLTPKQRSFLTPERLSPESFGFPPNPPGEVERLLIKAGVTASLDDVARGAARPSRAPKDTDRETDRPEQSEVARRKRDQSGSDLSPDGADYETNPNRGAGDARACDEKRQESEDPPPKT